MSNQPPCKVEIKDTLSLFSRIVYYLSANYQSASFTSTKIPFRLKLIKKFTFFLELKTFIFYHSYDFFLIIKLHLQLCYFKASIILFMLFHRKLDQGHH